MSEANVYRMYAVRKAIEIFDMCKVNAYRKFSIWNDIEMYNEGENYENIRV